MVNNGTPRIESKRRWKGANFTKFWNRFQNNRKIQKLEKNLKRNLELKKGS